VTLLVVMAAGALGAPARYLLERLVAARVKDGYPAGTLLVNVSGSLALGLIAGSALHGLPHAAAATGFLGAYTTFSTYAYEALELAQVRTTRRAAGYLIGTLMLASAAAWLGLAVTS